MSPDIHNCTAVDTHRDTNSDPEISIKGYAIVCINLNNLSLDMDLSPEKYHYVYKNISKYVRHHPKNFGLEFPFLM